MRINEAETLLVGQLHALIVMGKWACGRRTGVTYDRAKNVWLHIGVGAFHRTHRAWYLNPLLEKGGDSWHISLANVRNDGQGIMAQQAAQQGASILETMTPEGKHGYE